MKKLLSILIVNCALCIVNCGAVRAVKLCVVNEIKDQNNNYNNNLSYTSAGDNGSGFRGWAIGSGCAGTSFTGALSDACNGDYAIAGIAGCSTTATGTHEPSANDTGQYCYCKRTHVKGVKSAGVWVFLYALAGGSGACGGGGCAAGCGGTAQNNAAFRAALLAPSVP